MHWFTDPILKQYADFSGRATRREFWMFALWSYGVTIILLATIVALILLSHSDIMGFIAVGTFCVFALGTIIPSISITFRRLHDIGKSGWWLLVGLVPYVGGIVLIVFYCLPSQTGVNRYGANKYGVGAPLSPSQPQAMTATEPTPPAV